MGDTPKSVFSKITISVGKQEFCYFCGKSSCDGKIAGNSGLCQNSLLKCKFKVERGATVGQRSKNNFFNNS